MVLLFMEEKEINSLKIYLFFYLVSVCSCAPMPWLMWRFSSSVCVPGIKFRLSGLMARAFNLPIHLTGPEISPFKRKFCMVVYTFYSNTQEIEAGS